MNTLCLCFFFALATLVGAQTDEIQWEISGDANQVDFAWPTAAGEIFELQFSPDLVSGFSVLDPHFEPDFPNATWWEDISAQTSGFYRLTRILGDLPAGISERTSAYDFNRRLGTGNNHMAAHTVTKSGAKEDFVLLRQSGFSHCRIGYKMDEIDYVVGQEATWTIPANEMAELRQLVEWCLEEGLIAVVDPVHNWSSDKPDTDGDGINDIPGGGYTTRPAESYRALPEPWTDTNNNGTAETGEYDDVNKNGQFDATSDLEKMKALWQQIAVALADLPVDQVAFEPMNEPRSDDDAPTIMREVLETIRAVPGNEERLVIVTGDGFSTRQNLINAFNDDQIPLGAIPVGPEQLLNGDFSNLNAPDDPTNWNLQTGGGGGATFDASSGALVVSAITGTAYGNVQAAQPNLVLIPGDYELTLDASAATTGRTIRILLEKSETGFPDHSAPVELTLDTTTQSFTAAFTVADSVPSSRVLLQCGPNGGDSSDVTLDNVSLRRLDPAGFQIDPYLIATFHYYDPFEFTDQGDNGRPLGTEWGEVSAGGGPPTEVVLNGDFESPPWTTAWNFNGTETVSDSGGILTVSNVTSTAIGATQLIQPGFNLTAGEQYELTFRARSDGTADRGIGVRVQYDYAGAGTGSWHYNSGSPNNILLPTTWTDYSFQFTAATETVVGGGRLLFNVGGFNGNLSSVQLDDISLLQTPGSDDFTQVEDDFDAVIAANEAWATRNNTEPLPLYLGEYGVNNIAPELSRRRWNRWIGMVAKSRGISDCYWRMYGDWDLSKGMGPFTSTEKNDPSLRFFNAVTLLAVAPEMQAEDGTLTAGATIENDVPGARGAQFVRLTPAGTVETTLLASRSGIYDLVLRYRADAATTAKVTTSVNGVGPITTTVPLPASTTWARLTTPVSLTSDAANAGEVNIHLAVESGQAGFDVDEVGLAAP